MGLVRFMSALFVIREFDMATKSEIEDLIFLKECWLEDKQFMVFQNTKDELRAVEAQFVNIKGLKIGDKLKAMVRPRGCAGREIEKVYLP